MEDTRDLRIGVPSSGSEWYLAQVTDDDEDQIACHERCCIASLGTVHWHVHGHGVSWSPAAGKDDADPQSVWRSK